MRHMRSVAALVAGGVALAGAGARGQEPGPEVASWLQARAQDYDAWLSGGAEALAPTLWRERPAGEELLPGFQPPTSLAPLIRAVRSGVVNISTVNGQGGDKPTPFAERGTLRSLGSGFIISPDGHVVTNNHVVARARQIRVRLADGREFLADVVGRDPSTDVALLRLRGVGLAALPVSYLGDSDRLEVGDWVVAIGNPFGLDHSVAHGMISAKERVLGLGAFDDFIQTDTLINPGNSGGPLFNMRGEVVGVTTAIVSQGQGIGFAVPINMVKDLLPNLRENGRLARGWLGINIEDVSDPAEPARRRTVVREVFAGSPADRAGLRAKDQVLAVNGRPIESYLQLLRRVAILAPGTETRFTVLREGTVQEMAVQVGERPAPRDLQALLANGTVEAMGMVVRNLSPEAADGLGLRGALGVLVAGVLPMGPAERAGVRAGDLVVEVNRRKVQDIAALRREVQRAEPNKTVLLRVQRGDATQYLALQPQ